MTQVVIKCNGVPVSQKDEPKVITWGFVDSEYKEKPVSRHTGEVEKNRRTFVKTCVELILPTAIVVRLGMRASTAMAATQGADDLRRGFMEVIDVFTAIAEPILWCYALIGFIMMATGKSKEKGWERIKNVGYAYIGISMLPTMFQMLRWISSMIKGAMHF